MSVRAEHRRAGVAVDPENRQPDDFYPTPPPGTRALLAVESFHGAIWEPACGDGAISRVLEGAGHEVISSDVVHRGYGTPRVDFLLERRPWAPNLVTNPPNRLLDQFIRHATQIVPGKIALLARVQALTGVGRRRISETRPPARVWVFAPRLQIWRNGDVGTGSSVMDLAWFVWGPAHRGPPQVGWIP